MKIKLHRYVIYWLLLLLSLIVRCLPMRLVSKLGSVLGVIVYYLIGYERRKTIKHLKIAFGDSKSEQEIHQIAKETFANLGRNGCEWVKMPSLTDEQIRERVEVENVEVIHESLKKGKGLILLTGHFGNWEWLAACLGSLGLRGGVLARRIYFEPFNRFLVKIRESHRIETIYRDESPKKMLKMLKNNGILGILPDQDVDKINGIFIPFFGREAYTPTAPVAFALASKADIVPAFIVREKDRFRLIIEEPIKVEKTEDKETDLKRYTVQWNEVLERYIRKYPSQWVWMHRRWRTRPKTEEVSK